MPCRCTYVRPRVCVCEWVCLCLAVGCWLLAVSCCRWFSAGTMPGLDGGTFVAYHLKTFSDACGKQRPKSQHRQAYMRLLCGMRKDKNKGEELRSTKERHTRTPKRQRIRKHSNEKRKNNKHRDIIKMKTRNGPRSGLWIPLPNVQFLRYSNAVVPRTITIRLQFQLEINIKQNLAQLRVSVLQHYGSGDLSARILISFLYDSRSLKFSFPLPTTIQNYNTHCKCIKTTSCRFENAKRKIVHHIPHGPGWQFRIGGFGFSLRPSEEERSTAERLAGRQSLIRFAQSVGETQCLSLL